MEEGKDENIKKKIDESWKEAAKEEKSAFERCGEEPIEATFNLFISGLMMEALIALGEVENPVTKKVEANLNHAKFIIDIIGMLKDKTKNNLAGDEAEMLESILYDLRMRFVGRSNK